jgi:hypothetical protein
VIVFDGLDEAERILSSPLPEPLPHGLYVIVSGRAARDTEPPYLIVWGPPVGRLHVDELNAPAIADWMRRAGSGELREFAHDGLMVAEVVERTEGLPLYASYLIEELLQTIKMRGDLRAVIEMTPRGFTRYIRDQLFRLATLDEIRQRRDLQQLFAILSVSRGHQTFSDILQLTGATEWDLYGLPWQVSRWFSIENQSGVPTYAFGHPLVAQEFRAALGSQAELALQNVTDFCSRWRQHHNPCLGGLVGSG